MRLRLSSFSLALVGIVALCAGIHAQAKPDFSGTWVMVPAKSDFGPLPMPSAMTRTITHKDPSLKAVTVQTTDAGESTISASYTTDGKPQSNTISGNPMTSTGKWDGQSLIINSTLSQNGTDIAIEDRYTLSDGGKTLTVLRKFTTPDGSANASIVLAKK